MAERRDVRAPARIRVRARELRREPTEAEEQLWNALRGWGFAKFRRQHPIDRFILDFYCPAARLCVEVDGPVHDVQPERDAIRTEILNARGITVLRFENDQVRHETRDVLRRIRAEVRSRTRSASPLPPVGEGGEPRRDG